MNEPLPNCQECGKPIAMARVFAARSRGREPIYDTNSCRRRAQYKRAALAKKAAKGVGVLVLCVASLLGPRAAQADEAARIANSLALEQAIDVSLTAQFKTSQRCAPIPVVRMKNGDWYNQTCLGIAEADPLAKPFARNVLENALTAAAVNVGVRLWLRSPSESRRARFTRNVLRAVVLAYPALLLSNARKLSGR